MKYVVSWTNRDSGGGEEQARRILAIFSRWTPSSAATFHQFLGRVDGNGGFAVVETDDPTAILKDVTKFVPWLHYDVFPVVDVQEVAVAYNEAFGFWDSVS